VTPSEWRDTAREVKLLDEFGELGPRVAIPNPEQPKGVAVPSHQRVGLHDSEDRTPLDEPRQHDESQTRGGIGATTPHSTFELQLLLAEEEVLGDQARPGPQPQPSEM
jgi:hypothetical protein